MRRLLFFLIAVMVSTNAFAQTQTAGQVDDTFWKEKVDTSTDWGKWLTSLKPYWDKFGEATTEMSLSATHINPIGLTPQEMLVKVNAGYVVYYKAIQKITPPEELKNYHAIILNEFAEIAQKVPTNQQQAQQIEAIIEKSNNEATKELVQVFIHHGVPQNIIDEFTK